MSMFVKRTSELNLLTKQYQESGSCMVILYGRKGIGKTTLLKEFIREKPAYYYCGVECEGRLQFDRMKKEWLDSGEEPDNISDYALLLSSLIHKQEARTVIVLDEFHVIARNSLEFLEAFQGFHALHNPVMFILCSSSIRFVENEMVGLMGSMASYITSYLKLKEFSFIDFINFFPKSTVETCIYANAILGGVPGYLKEWREDRPLQANITGILLDKNHWLLQEPQNFLKQDLREPSVYNTILSSIAEGNRKLNDLHLRTGYSRAKIMVYLKHLIQLDIVEKLVPLGEEGKENAKKGLYRIRDHYLHFWYRFVFPDLSRLMLGKAAEVYKDKIDPFLNDYMAEYFADVCLEFLKLMNLKQRLPARYQWWDRWYGKNGTIDIIAKEPEVRTLAGKCIWEDRKADSQDYKVLQGRSKEAGIYPDTWYLFSKNGFSEELKDQARSIAGIWLVGLEDL